MNYATANGSQKPELPNELPPVEPPTARFIIQLFVIPAAIVLVLVVAYLLLVQLPFGRLANGGRDINDYVRSIRSDNEHRRWRSAQELANLISNDANLAKNASLLGELTWLLEQELDHPNPNKPELAEYLGIALGSFQTTKADPVEGHQVDPIATLSRALGPEQPTVVRVAAAIGLSRQADRAGGAFAESTAVVALAKAAEAKESEVRSRAVYALGYFSGDQARDALRKSVAEDEDRVVKYNAGVSLARKGDVEAAPIVREMLSTNDLKQVVQRPTPSETDAAIKAIELETLWALRVSAPKHPELALKAKGEIEALAKSPPKDVQIEARDLLKKLPENR